jgi:hypothetical protein
MLSYREWAAARAAAAFDARTLAIVFGGDAFAEAQRLALSASSFGRPKQVKHWERVAKLIARRGRRLTWPPPYVI